VDEKDEQAKEAIRYAIEQDQQIREDIKRTLEYHDRTFFEQVVSRVIDRLCLSIPDRRGFIDTAYEWFKSTGSNKRSEKEEMKRPC
jgi:hypothetical protein